MKAMTTLSLEEAGRIPLAVAGVKRADCLAWSPGGQVLAVAGRGDEVLAWDVKGDRLLTVYSGHSGCEEVLDLAWSPDGTRLASSASDHTVQVWEPHTGKQLWQVEFGEGPALAHWNPAPGWGRGRHWGMEDVDVLGQGSGDGGYSPRALTWSPDGDFLAVGIGGTGSVYVLAAATGRQERVCAGVAAGVKDLAWSPDGKYLLAAVAKRSLRRYDAATGALLSQEDVPVSWEGAMTLSPDGARIAFGMNAGRVRVAKWTEEADDGFETLYTLDQGVTRYPIVGMTFSPAGRVVASYGSDGALWLWDVLTGEVLVRANAARKVLAAAWSPDDAMLAGGCRDGSVRLWEIPGDLARGEGGPGEDLVVQQGDAILRTHRPFLDDQTVFLNGLMGKRFVVQDVQDHCVFLVSSDSAHSISVPRTALRATHFVRAQDE